MGRLISAWLGRRELARAEAALADHPFSGPESDAAAWALVEAANRLAAIRVEPLSKGLRGMTADIVPGAGERMARAEGAAANRALGFVASTNPTPHLSVVAVWPCPTCGATR